ncbi:hypothetical protein TREMEDRAFT_31269 [Tremella mesenterica DSM 1558]|uniref:uncharacterized protein n=1 Tax=Tremella mesenterica (strain ATCC 24925 / CBS 8224 / DSM 1558 / NBRC 9311 / NRRL Y-6157 / RJB 2259-6 / UBC 559-6) TaxID=578456 RepID=UPI0003F4A327|nr:uncharacterized protein TREMEDRAFT_31269 [Tremella mesenterica DSM 1558]EIW68938.1 hypothetical protein TREMEDRAFT_31269 [Tremella mesenterica DSM 1558]
MSRLSPSAILRSVRPSPSQLGGLGGLRTRQASLSPHTPPITPYDIFDEPSKARQRDRAIRRLKERGDPTSSEDEQECTDYKQDLKSPPKSILDLCSHSGQLTKILQETLPEEERTWYMVEPSIDRIAEALYRDADNSFPYPPRRIQASPANILANPELNVLKDTFEAVVSSAGLHWVGDIVGALTQIRHLLKPDGVFVGAVLGGDTLFELRTSLQLAEQERRGGIANRVSPMINPTDAPSLLTRAGFTLTTVDIEDMSIRYPSMWELISDLRDMGESNAILGRRAYIPRDVLLAAEGIYKEMYGSDAEPGVPATFQIIYLIGWKPGPTEPKPLERGTGRTSLKDVL